ncbi:MAG TPA: AraC family transcriptional regulator [Cyclobacteriaceae bacterium]|nr:AraC family transcriptional regulator [Cyclobacteriaceae bacterium]
MNQAYNYITVDKPNILTRPCPTIPFAQLVDAPVDENNKFEKEVANVQLQDMYLPNFSIRVSQGEFGRDALLINTSAEGIDLMGSCLFQKGELSSHSKHGKVLLESYSGTQNFKFDPMNEMRHRIAAHTPFHIIHFAVDPKHFLQFLPDNESWSDELRNKVFNNQRIFGKHSPAITHVQQRALQIIFNCPLEGRLGEWMIESAIVQIMLIQLHALFQQDKPATAQPLTRRDTDLVQSLKEYLGKTFLEEHTLDTLAKQFGVNTNKLMTLFKKFFGQSIFEYIQEMKMEHAHNMLRDQDILVTDVARVVGYKNPNHFSAAFKRKFGFNPSQIRS